ncbi:hypothetical protein P389DRAFT_207195 [Cystobasidium minutum MCA 4210]|uniref:uncharacterized protein n=1 Tax=Cystobasidium minutum MCA 4210 TaxID=1397322 RepID=UPI0034CFE535|eukprot:jgi/Rhomi1/207195/estExt_Genemark1.C_1_t10061
MFIATHIVNYRRYYAGGSGKHTMILTIASWVPTSTGVMAYTFSNFLAMLLLKSQAKPFRPWVSRIWVTVYNFVLVIGLVGYTVPCLILGTLLSRGNDKILDLGPETLQLLDTVIADPSTLMQHIVRLQELQNELTKTGDYVVNQYPRLYYLSTSYCAFYSLAGVFSLVFVYNLRKHTVAQRRYLNPSLPVDSGVVTSLPGEHAEDLELDVNFAGANVSRANRKADRTRASRAASSLKTFKNNDNNALERLVADLTLCVPVVLILTIYYPIAGHIADLHRYDTAWKWTEFQTGLFSWPQTLTGNIIIGYFIYNSWKKPGRYGAGNQTVFDSKPASDGDARLHQFPRPPHIETQDFYRGGKGTLTLALPNGSFESASAAEKSENRFPGN